MIAQKKRYNFIKLKAEFLRTDLSISLKDFLISKGVKASNGQFSGYTLKQTRTWVSDRLYYYKSQIDKVSEDWDKAMLEELLIPVQELRFHKQLIIRMLEKRIKILSELPKDISGTNELISILQTIKTELGEPIRINNQIINTDGFTNLTEEDLGEFWEDSDKTEKSN